ncbi:AAA family ATPase [Chelatococcus asaccharovorans]|uniref:AAA domain-containing protein n=1 Tax=Chelatococcus asaccharovorans TaxID=28210 RepID=A0A2V3UBM8_9HYPH|nr:AAA family ATPase [Chelatococcus asaccharovorans]MBS7703279.1 AAA family ATPase [Chelatococcus asaccharovorans]PXW61611.1 AAA domain-containing protein [Chelatococcus asaccharovorans]
MTDLPPIQSFEDFESASAPLVTAPFRSSFGAMTVNEVLTLTIEERWLVRGFLQETGFSVVFGPPGTAKTFFLLDVALHVALGWTWMGYDVRQAGVIYVSAEGQWGVPKRFQAWAQEHGAPTGAPFILMTKRVNLLDPESVLEFIREVEHLGKTMLIRPGLIVFDTLARSMPGANENAEGMSLAVEAIQRISETTRTQVVAVHHTGKDRERGARGWSGLKGAVDAEIELQKDESRLITARASKVKDEADGSRVRFRLKRLVIKEDALGREISSCVIVPTDETERVQRPETRLVEKNKIAYQCLVQAILDSGTDGAPGGGKRVKWQIWRDACRRGGLLFTEDDAKFDKVFAAAGTHLRSRGIIGVEAPWVWICK